MKIDRDTAKEISDRISDFVRTLESDYGIKLDKATARYSDVGVDITIKTKLTKDNRDEGLLTPEEKEYDFQARLNNLPPRGHVFKSPVDGSSYVITEWIPRGKKYKVLAINQENGKRYKFPVASIRNIMKFV